MRHSNLHEDLEYLLTHIIQYFMQFMQQTGLSRPQIHALLYIYHAGECPISEIGSLTGSSPAAASQLVERLVQQGLVQRSEDALNRRIKKLRMTEKSLKLFQQGIADNQLIQDLMAALTPDEREIVHLAFGYLVRASRQIQYTHLRKENPSDAQNA